MAGRTGSASRSLFVGGRNEVGQRVNRDGKRAAAILSYNSSRFYNGRLTPS